MKYIIWLINFCVIISAFSCRLVDQKESGIDKVVLYGAIWERENFRLPAESLGVLTDYDIDSAIRLGLIMPSPREGPETKSTNYTFLCGKLNAAITKLDPRERMVTVKRLDEMYGRTVWSDQFFRENGAGDINFKTSAYFKLLKIKKSREERGAWNP